jgi:acetyltransferase-like isoleucine patch superfamily enzyme
MFKSKKNTGAETVGSLVNSLTKELNPVDIDDDLASIAVSSEAASEDLEVRFESTVEELESAIAVAVESWSEGKTELSSVQLDAATIAGVLGANPQALLDASCEMSAPENSLHNVIGMFGGESKRSMAMENYDDRATDQLIPKSIAYNIAATDPSDFVKTLFPFVLMKPSDSGMQIHADMMYIQDDVSRNLDAKLTDFGRKNLTHAAIDSTIIGEEHTVVIPSVNANTNSHFVDNAVIPTRTVINEGAQITTNYLKFGDKFDLLAISQTDALLERGIMDVTDQLDPRLALKDIVIKVGDDIFKFDIENITSSNFSASRQESTTDMILSFASKSVLIDKDKKQLDGSDPVTLADVAAQDLTLRLDLEINGRINIDTGDCVVYLSHVSIYKAYDANGVEIPTDAAPVLPLAAEFDDMVEADKLGYSLVAFRSNLNRRQRGHLIGQNSYVEEYYNPLRTPFTILRPTNSTKGQNDVATLVAAIHIDMANEAVDTLNNAANTLRDFTSNGNVDIDRPDYLGIGRLYLKPHFIERTLDMPAEINSISSFERAADVRAVLVNNIRDMCARLFANSNYQAASQVTKAQAGVIGNHRPKVTVSTDSVTAAHLHLDGDNRLLTDLFDFEVVTNDNYDMRGKIFLTFSTGYQVNGINPLGFGNTIYAPELLFNINISRNNTISKECAVYKHFRLVVNTPVMGLINVDPEGLEEALGRV